METSQVVVEYLLSQEATVEEIAQAVQRDKRTVYRALEALKKNTAFRVLRFGEHGSYKYRVEKAVG